MRIAYFDCFSGIAGDMVLGAMLDAGLSLDVLSRELGKLNLKGYELKKRKVMRGGITGTKFDIILKASSGSHSHRSVGQILKLIDESSLSPRVKTVSKEIFGHIGAAEAGIHGIADKKNVQLHELGDIDSIIDIVGSAIAFEKMDIEAVYSSSINFGRSVVNTKHGILPVPSPASLELLKGVPSRITDIDAELVTPTGAGILKTLSKGFGDMPQMKIDRIGYGAGSKEFTEMPNMLRVMIGDKKSAFKEDSIFIIETNIDDMNPQNFEYLFDKLFAEGALDVYTESIQMKKTRPAFKLTVLTDLSKIEKLCSIIFSETTSIGLRYYEAKRFKLQREIIKVNTRYGGIKVKLSRGPDSIFTVSPEYDDCARIARSKRVPLKRVYDEAKKAVEV